MRFFPYSYSSRIKQWAGLWLGLMLLSWFAAASAQPPAWDEPINLSQSGTATFPQLFQDNEGQYHILWQDTLQRQFLYVTGNGSTWSEPIAVEPPFAAVLTQSTATDPLPPIIPTLITDDTDTVHAFWRNSLNELRYSRVGVADLAVANQWTPAVTLAGDVPSFAVTTGADGQVAALYAVAGDNPEIQAGVYYRGSADGGETWRDAAALYTSPYFSLLDPAEFHLDITPGTRSVELLAAWDDAAQEKIYTSRSGNNGETWSEPIVVDSREITDPESGLSPTQLQIIARQGVTHRLWLAGHNDADVQTDSQTCALYHSWSSDNGQNWTPRLRLLADVPECVQSASLFTGADNTVWLMAITASQTTLQVWGGTTWGEAQIQTPLTQFTDPQTFRPIGLTCQQPAINNEAELVILGCGGTRGQDVWLLRRSVGELADWLPQDAGESLWQIPALVQQDAAAMSQLSLVMDQANQPHLFWIQPQRRTADNDPGTVFYGESAIYHAVRLNGAWINAIPVIAAVEGDVEELAATVSPDDRLLVAWSNPQTGLLFFSQANSQQAIDPNQWSPPLPLPLPGAAATSPDIGVMADGTVVVAYTVPINEKRGVYLTTSRDNGLSWSEPIEVFDAAAAGWAMLDQPHLAFTDNNHLHLTWRHLSLPPTSEPQALYTARSIDGGQSWSEAIPVIQGNIVWSDIVGWSTTQLHIVWRETQTGRTTLWHVPSADDGLTLERPIRITTFEDVAGPTSLSLDPYGKLHLFQIAQPLNSPVTLLPFLWNDQTWLPEPELNITSETVPDGSRLSSVVNLQGEVVVAVAGQTEGEGEEAVWVSGRVLEQPLALPTPLPTLTPTPLPTATSVPSPTPTAEPTISFPKEPETANNPTIGPLTINSTTDGIIIGVFLAASFVGMVFLWVLRASRSGK
jgi:hypothetical protein